MRLKGTRTYTEPAYWPKSKLLCSRAIVLLEQRRGVTRLFLLAYFSGLRIAGIGTGLHHYSFDFGDDSTFEYRDA